MQLDHLRESLRTLGAKACHERLMLRAWTRGQPLDDLKPSGADGTVDEDPRSHAAASDSTGK